eukprot:TRINITY_DN3778_c0_g1_i1.p1 TRINITY_DN3778_c0_g1~~TRINITY_DN3778_c0_g1_i1.p1  ORF type:complete len:409 (+),score=62.40 TRINITY_DN3778_c0_g1_i1:3-1229(+)
MLLDASGRRRKKEYSDYEASAFYKHPHTRPKPFSISRCLLLTLFLTFLAYFSYSFLPSSTTTSYRSCSDQVSIALFYGQTPGETIQWNTGVWQGWGRKGNFSIDWSGIKISKPDSSVCGLYPNCQVSSDQQDVANSDAVVMEVVNHFMFYGSRGNSLEVDFPKSGRKQLLIQTHFEQPSAYPNIFEPALLKRFNASMIPDKNSEIPITLHCPWTNNPEDFLKKPPIKTASNQIAYFASRQHSPGREDYVKELAEHLNIDIYEGAMRNAVRPYQKDSPNWIHQEIELMGNYKFVLAFEVVNVTSFVTHELSQVLLGGAVPIYMGADDVDGYTPGPHSIIKVSDYKGPADMATHLKKLIADDKEYNRLFDWKKNKRTWRELQPSFVGHVDNCVYYAECNLCKYVVETICK